MAPWQVAVTPVQTPFERQVGAPVKPVGSSIRPSQLLSMPSHTSAPPLVFWHSQPSLSLPLASKKPARQTPIAAHARVQLARANGYEQVTPQRPQFVVSVIRSNPSSTTLLQLSSRPLHTSTADAIWHSHPFLGSPSVSLKPDRQV